MPERLPISDELLWAILRDELTDEDTNRLVWERLGYRWDPTSQGWQLAAVPPDWQQDYPIPPDFIASRPATVKLTRSIPAPLKQLLKEELGFEGYRVGELVPRKTRRATVVSWLLAWRYQLREVAAFSQDP
jgi:hypothetical protein